MKTQSQKCTNDAQLTEEIKKFQRMRLANQEEEDTEIKDIFEKAASKNVTQTTQSRSSKTLFDSEDDEEIMSSKPIKKKSQYSSDENLDEDLIGSTASKTQTGRGRGTARGATRARGRGSRGGRGGTTKTTAAAAKTSKKSSINYGDDSDADIIDLSDDNVTASKRPKPQASAKPIATSTSMRRNRIDYESDEDDDHMYEKSSSKKPKQTSQPKSSDDEATATSTFSIFKRVANKKKF